MSRTGLQLPLDPRVAELIANGKTDREIANALNLSYNTIRWHLQQAHQKMGTSRRAQLLMKYMTTKLEEASKEEVTT